MTADVCPALLSALQCHSLGILVRLTAACFTAFGIFGHGLQALAPVLHLSPKKSHGHLPELSLVAVLLG